MTRKYIERMSATKYTSIRCGCATNFTIAQNDLQCHMQSMHIGTTLNVDMLFTERSDYKKLLRLIEYMAHVKHRLHVLNNKKVGAFFTPSAPATVSARLDHKREVAFTLSLEHLNQSFRKVLRCDMPKLSGATERDDEWCLPLRWWSDVYRKGISTPHKDVFVLQATSVPTEYFDAYKVEVLRWIPGSVMRIIPESTKKEAGYVVYTPTKVLYDTTPLRTLMNKARKSHAELVAKRIGGSR